MSRHRIWTVLAVALGAFGLTACSSSPSSSSANSSTASSPANSSAPASTASSSVPIEPVTDPSPAGTFGTKPTITVPTGPAPSGLQSTDLITGSGPAVTAGATITTQYVGVDYATGKQFDASWNDGSGQPVSFSLNGVIPGWTVGLVGMKVGGRRELVIPPRLAYGASGQGPIGPNQTLIFIVDLVKIG